MVGDGRKAPNVSQREGFRSPDCWWEMHKSREESVFMKVSKEERGENREREREVGEHEKRERNALQLQWDVEE